MTTVRRQPFRPEILARFARSAVVAPPLPRPRGYLRWLMAGAALAGVAVLALWLGV
ncbi:MAG: hypothetical protein ACREFY_14905 [Acetobacteraceae bacterium]